LARELHFVPAGRASSPWQETLRDTQTFTNIKQKRKSGRTNVNSQVIRIAIFGFAVICFCAVGSPARLSGQDSSNETGIVAILDVAKVFKNYPPHEEKMSAIKQEADKLKAEIQTAQDKIRQDAMPLQDLEPGTAERNQLEAELEQRQASLRVQARQSEQDLLNREAKIYYDTYQEMQRVVAGLAQKHSISLVLRFDSSEFDSTNRAEVIKGVNREVVFHQRLDLTKMVIQGMNGASASADSGTQKR
jgi:Skp family chaperone for outer membrane proteins